MQVSDVHETATAQLNVKWLPVARAGVYYSIVVSILFSIIPI